MACENVPSVFVITQAVSHGLTWEEGDLFSLQVNLFRINALMLMMAALVMGGYSYQAFEKYIPHAEVEHDCGSCSHEEKSSEHKDCATHCCHHGSQGISVVEQVLCIPSTLLISAANEFIYYFPEMEPVGIDHPPQLA